MAPAPIARVKARLDRQLESPQFSASQLYHMTLPFILDSLSITFINVLITALISSSGETSVAAVNLVSPLLGLVVCIINGVSAGGTVAVTQSCGSGNGEKACQAAGHTLWLTFVTGSVLCVGFILFPRASLTLLYRQADPAVMEKAVRYMVPGGLSIIIFTVYTGAYAVLRGLGESKKCLWLSIIINLAYLVFSVLFINVLRMDVQGSAAALLLARAVGSLAALGFLFLPKDLPVTIPVRCVFSFRRDVLRSITEVGAPFGLEQLLLYGGNIVITVLLVPLGTSAVAVNAVAISLFSFMTSAANAASALAMTVVGRCVGARDGRSAFSYGWKSVVLALGLLAAACVPLYPLSPWLLEHLYHVAAAPRAQAMGLLGSILLPALLFWPVSSTMPSVLRAAHDTVFPSVLAIAAMWAVRVGLGWVLAFPVGMGLAGLWVSMWAEWAVRAAPLGFRFIRRRWLRRLAAG